MNVYVESNFILELALEQEQYTSCDAIVSLCEQKRIRLLLPAFSFAEPYETLIRRTKERKILKDRLAQEMQQLARSKAYMIAIEMLQQITSMLVNSIEEEKQRLNATFEKLLHLAESIPLNQTILSSSLEAQSELNLSPQDAFVYSSVLEHLTRHPQQRNCFLNKNSRDFDDPDIVRTLDAHQCKMLFDFEHGYRYILHQIEENKNLTR